MWTIFFLDEELSLYFSTFYIQSQTDSLHMLRNPLFLIISDMYRPSGSIVQWVSALNWIQRGWILSNLGRTISARTFRRPARVHDPPARVDRVIRSVVRVAIYWCAGVLSFLFGILLAIDVESAVA
jgi:hypothetical protein